MIEITRKTFEDYPTDSKLNTLFDIAVSTEEKVHKIEQAKKWNNTYAFFGGMGAAITLFFGQIGFKLWRGGMM